jgi:hypothetical protein
VRWRLIDLAQWIFELTGVLAVGTGMAARAGILFWN